MHHERTPAQSMSEEMAGYLPPRVAFQGEAGAFSEDAVHALFEDQDVVVMPERDFVAVARAVITRDAEYGVLPVENSIHGSVIGAYDVLGSGSLSVIGEVVRPIRHCLLGLPGISVGELRRVISHPVALAQCGQFFNRFARIEAVAFYDTAGAAREVANLGDRTLGAIAGRPAAARYGLEIIAEDIQDRADNVTRFFLVCRADAVAARAPTTSPTTPYKGVLILETQHRAGALVDALLPFSERSINLTRIESRPADEVWSYRFFLELVTGGGTQSLHDAIADVRARGASVLLLGAFPASSATSELPRSPT